jgi:hypothetical protein
VAYAQRPGLASCVVSAWLKFTFNFVTAFPHLRSAGTIHDKVSIDRSAVNGDSN